MSAVFSVRIPKELKERMERLNVNWAEEVRRFLEKRVEEEERRELLEEIRSFRESLKGRRFTPPEELVREARDSR